MINFRDVHAKNPKYPQRSIDFLYLLLCQRPSAANISHKALPSYEDHRAFVNAHPYRYWYVIETAETATPVGAIYATHRNELGIAIEQEFHRQGYARRALEMFIRTHNPLPAIRGHRNGNWLANVAMDNDPSHNLFHAIGGRPLQVTYEIPPASKEPKA